MAADCTVVAADHPESAASEVVGNAGFIVDPTVEIVAAALDRALSGERPSTSPTDRAQRYDRDNVARQAEAAYQQAVDNSR